jgi:hypothetical protein
MTSKDETIAIYDEIGATMRIERPPIALGDDPEGFAEQVILGLTRVRQCATEATAIVPCEDACEDAGTEV